ncbi:hypothetical protein ABK040_000270 [Willaertia magna]
MRSFFIFFFLLFSIGIAINYNTKYSTPTFLLRFTYHLLTLKNKMIDPAEGDPHQTLFTIYPQWNKPSITTINNQQQQQQVNNSQKNTVNNNNQKLTIESQTLNNLIGYYQLQLNKKNDLEIRNLMNELTNILYPPISYHNIYRNETIDELNGSLFITLRDPFYFYNYTKVTDKKDTKVTDKVTNKKEKVLFLVFGNGGLFGNVKSNGFQLRSLVEYLQPKLQHSITKILAVDRRLIALTESEKKDSNFISKNLISEQVNDIKKAYKYLLQKNYKNKDIVMMGDSLGCNLILNLLLKEIPKEEHPYSVILISGIYNLNFEKTLQFWKLENELLIPKAFVTLMSRIYKQDSNNYSIINNNNLLNNNLLKNNLTEIDSKVLVVYSNHEEFTLDNEGFVGLLKEGKDYVNSVSVNNNGGLKVKELKVISENYMIHSYPYFHYYSGQIANTMEKIVNFMDLQDE